jgi:hypothetical protein
MNKNQIVGTRGEKKAPYLLVRGFFYIRGKRGLNVPERSYAFALPTLLHHRL